MRASAPEKGTASFYMSNEKAIEYGIISKEGDLTGQMAFLNEQDEMRHTMKLKRLIDRNACLSLGGPQKLETEVRAVAYDSRSVEPGDCFVCIRGYAVDGHAFMGQAADRGASAFVMDRQDLYEPALKAYPDKTVLLVEDSRLALSEMADRYYGRPSGKMVVVGVTGTNGKTSVTTYLYNALRKLGYEAGLIGTIETRIGDRRIPAGRTTPESLDLQALLSDMNQSGVTHVLMEVSSHALCLDRVRHVSFDFGVFTNLTRDHLDFHKTMAAYAEEKYKLLDRSQRLAVLNLDDACGEAFGRRLSLEGRAWRSFGLTNKADVTAERKDGVWKIRSDGSPCGPSLDVSGRFDLYNKLAVFTVLEALGLKAAAIEKAFRGLEGAEGRFQRIAVPPGFGFEVIVDYAHTPDALENVIETIRGESQGRLITVFGCGGERDRTKRPLMGAIAAAGSDHVILTDDNPRHEDPEVIIEEIQVGIGTGSHEVVRDRREAIRKAIARAGKGDVVLIAGKGHEKVQVVGDEVFPHDDAETAGRILEEMAC